MGVRDANSLPAVGFLTALEDEERGWLGGYLILNTSSRPLEFHCTAPVKPNRAQQILYGPTLESYVCGEQIGAALVGKPKVETAVIFTDRPAMMSVRPLVESPVVLVAAEECQGLGNLRLDAGHRQVPQPHTERLGEFKLARRVAHVRETFSSDQHKVSSWWNGEQGARQMDLDEPFERIREAIEETQLRKA